MLQSGGAAARQQLLATNVLLALASQGASWLWSAALESIEEQGQSPSRCHRGRGDYGKLQRCRRDALCVRRDGYRDWLVGAAPGGGKLEA